MKLSLCTEEILGKDGYTMFALHYDEHAGLVMSCRVDDKYKWLLSNNLSDHDTKEMWCNLTNLPFALKQHKEINVDVFKNDGIFHTTEYATFISAHITDGKVDITKICFTLYANVTFDQTIFDSTPSASTLWAMYREAMRRTIGKPLSLIELNILTAILPKHKQNSVKQLFYNKVTDLIKAHTVNNTPFLFRTNMYVLNLAKPLLACKYHDTKGNTLLLVIDSHRFRLQEFKTMEEFVTEYAEYAHTLSYKLRNAQFHMDFNPLPLFSYTYLDEDTVQKIKENLKANKTAYTIGEELQITIEAVLQYS